ncbi:MAG: hypothetical protein D3926_07245 [Desulfobacteraceae bacterium]|nr:MAG: hypothetical protein D3926_07245 [Desulfobacteraceae bacterium]
MTALIKVFSSWKLIWITTALTLMTFVLSICWVVFMISRIPEDYFLNPDRDPFKHHPLYVRLPLAGFKNALGLLLILAGIIMLFTPGQGILTIVMGVAIMDFPGKRSLEILLLRQKKISQSLNWIRRRKGLSDILIP